MGNKKAKAFLFAIIAVILGWTILKHFDAENMKFEKPALDALYILTFIMSVIFVIRSVKEK